MKFCNTCSVNRDTEANYCRECGTKLSEVIEMVEATTAISPDFKLKTKRTPIYAHCDYCGEFIFMPYEGRDGRFFCDKHRLPENREETRFTHPPAEYRIIYSGGKEIIKK
jgi:hypothetical protein